ncbi:DNA adenine methylase [Paenibacillus sp. yr247]|uniref:DNA adenine methylase n=1 Tax=Paenibacillus sp. yr247 TaxID=1761880 RepID=UPI00087F7094|nr:DNA adenine methylase [Paenibacillus sp. yr247]SDO18361.1 DNA adenine methylase [Paenibacillus sp. yr247]
MKKVKEQRQKLSFWMATSKLETLMKLYGTDSITEVFSRLVDEKLDSNFTSQQDNRSVITSIGGKNKLARRIIELMPEHSVYVEPFGNTASILLQKVPVKKEVYNDIHEDVVNFFTVIQTDPLALYHACTRLPYAEVVYKDMLSSPIPDDSVERAARFYYLSRAGFLASSKSSTGFRTNASDGRNFGKFYYKECERFYAVSKRLQSVELLNRDFRKVIKAYSDKPEVLILADPPYYDGTDYYEDGFSLKDHRNLARLLASIKGKAMVLNSQNDQIHKLYTGLGFNFKTIRTKYASRKAMQDETGKRTRPVAPLYVYMNF